MKGKVVVITGASSGIGEALAKEFAIQGCNLVLAARNHEKLVEIKKNLSVNNLEVLTVQTDVTSEDSCKRLIDRSIEKFGHIDVLINNAGISMRALFEDVQLDVIKKVMDVNFWGAVYCSKYALPHLLKSKGSVVGISSIAGYKGLPARTGYSASKFALQGFLEVIRVENRKRGLHVLIACPGFTTSNIRHTALNQDGMHQGESPRNESKMMSAEEVAKKIVKAIKQRKNYIILTTQGKLLVFLNKFFPSFMDKVVYNHFAKEKQAPLK